MGKKGQHGGEARGRVCGHQIGLGGEEANEGGNESLRKQGLAALVVLSEAMEAGQGGLHHLPGDRRRFLDEADEVGHSPGVPGTPVHFLSIAPVSLVLSASIAGRCTMRTNKRRVGHAEPTTPPPSKRNKKTTRQPEEVDLGEGGINGGRETKHLNLARQCVSNLHLPKALDSRECNPRLTSVHGPNNPKSTIIAPTSPPQNRHEQKVRVQRKQSRRKGAEGRTEFAL